MRSFEHGCYLDAPVSHERALADMRKEKKIRCLARGPDAQWERIVG